MERNVHDIEQRFEALMRKLHGEVVTSRTGKPRDYSNVISDRNRQFILCFLKVARARVPSLTRVLFYGNDLWTLAKIMRTHMDDASFEDLTKEDVDMLVGVMKTYRMDNGMPYSEATVHGMLVALKKSIQWSRGYSWQSKKYPPEVEEIKLNLKKTSRIQPEQLLTREEVESLASAARNIRDIALIHTLYESATRISEFLLTRLKDVTFDDYGAVLFVPHGKTGRRKVRLVTSATILAQWIRAHPDKDNPDAWLWTDTKMKDGLAHNRLRYGAVREQLKRLASRANVKKRVNPHAFRHSRMTELANQITEPQQCSYAGWVIGSNMPRIYVHMSMRDVDDAILKANGIKKPDAVQHVQKKCARCEAVNQAVAKLCHRCMLPLDDKTAMEVGERKRGMLTPEMEWALLKLLQKEDVREILKETLSQKDVGLAKRSI
ncbi:MAG: site-specific integrase [Candidatus Aenigmarchaeota archaeon]|nr:site-specific integrase [Candidatus Aenigmarchaeota archaeon]